MRLLLDTHLLIWAANDPEKLSKTAFALLSDNANHLFFSPVSLAEVGIKRALNKPDFPIEPADLSSLLLDNGYEELAFNGHHACRVRDMPAVHKDPFDRMLVAQALAEGIPFATADAVLANYPGRVMVV